MQAKSIYKVPDGKLLKIFLDYNEKNKKINTIKITGDFFAYPEEAIEKLENELKDSVISKDLLIKKISLIIEKYEIEFIGLNPEGLSEGILRCLN